MNIRPIDEIQAPLPESSPSRPDLPDNKKIGKLLDRCASRLLEQRTEKVVFLAERRSYTD
ncbi:hypothetical protein LEP1GSC047_1379 [Leptospira inadai serovar Lyme str. 10]|uniref:Uncharacterized protein n=2 Tax=Leptospira inadai serovar Lyme TaxID=293084 RepID=V6HA35_9LEPT|nr:hypothetical protein LEP1GSC047_1379 [Leptospira inadai serovar Lyme str. 10]PNV75278.1 hypothetical protein BES34_008410 [Leptospira inadai serovar Lyme]